MDSSSFCRSALAGECRSSDPILWRGIVDRQSLGSVRRRLMVPSFQVMVTDRASGHALPRAGDVGSGSKVGRCGSRGRSQRGRRRNSFSRVSGFRGQTTKRSTSDHADLGYMPVGVGCRFRRIRTAGELSLTRAGFKNNRPLRSYNRYIFHSRKGT